MLQSCVSDNKISHPPLSDELEVSIIGPGYGEAVLVHLGDNNWIIIDSCKRPDESVPEPLRYLDQIGVDPRCVVAVLITHWDDDHCKGMSQVIQICAHAQIVMSSAFVQKDFLAFSALYGSPMTRNVRAGVKEIGETMNGLGAAERPITSAYPGRRLFTADDLTTSHGLPIEVWTLSPSDEEYQNFLAWVAEQMPQPDETRRVAVKRIRNDLSVVVHMMIGDDVLLFGGDLEEEGKPGTGWSAIMALPGRPLSKAGMFKVSHHGSANGHHAGIPTNLLTAAPVAVVAPFKSGKVSLPTPQDVTRICGYAGEAYTTATLQGRATSKHDPMVDKTIREVTRRFSTIKADPGMIRLRKKAGSSEDWRVDKFGTAGPLAKIY